MNLCDTAKRLLMAGQIGARIEHQNGHRYLVFSETDCPGINRDMPFDVWYYTSGGKRSCKVYGSAIDALDRLDEMLSDMGLPNLLTQFHRQWGGDWKEAWGFYE